MNQFALETTLHWAGVALYIVGVVLLAHAVFFRGAGVAAAVPGGPAMTERPGTGATTSTVRWGLWATLAGLVPHSVALVLRYFAVGHGPYMLKYEVLSSNAWITTVMILIFVWRRPTWTPLALVALPASILMVGLGLFTNPELRNLPPTLRSMWLVFHVLFNKLAVGAFILSLGAAIQLLRGRGDAAKLEAYTIRFVGFGFVFWTTTIGAGAIWANQSWGRYWGWDPIETWSLVTWLAYATLLHGRVFFRLAPRTVAWGTIACFVLSVLTVLIFPFLIPSMHSAYFQ